MVLYFRNHFYVQLYSEITWLIMNTLKMKDIYPKKLRLQLN